jgi:iron complex transport system ATP-binding protein
MGHMLALEGLSVMRGRHATVAGVTAQFSAGRIVGICGPNGAGKSTLLSGIAGTLPIAGSVRWNGRPLKGEDFSHMPQDIETHAALSVLETVLLGRLETLRWVPSGDDIASAAEALHAVNLAHLAERRIDSLSGGQRQLVFLAQKLAKRPQLLLLDEPLSALDLNRQLLSLDILAAYARDRPALVLVVLHDLSLVARYASQLLLLKDGVAIRAGTPADVLETGVLRSTYRIEAEILLTSLGHPVIAPLAAIRAEPGDE